MMLHDARTIKVGTSIGGLKCDVSGHLWLMTESNIITIAVGLCFISFARKKSIRLLNLRCLIMEFEYIQFVY